MIKPKDFDTATEFGEFTPLTPGGHYLIIKKVEETTSSAGNPMIIVSFDTTSKDTQPLYYKEQYANDTRAEKKWGGIARQVVYNNDGTTSKGFKSFVTSAEKSNPGFTVNWDKFADCFKDKLVGGVFRKEEYINNKGKLATIVKLMYFCSNETIAKGVKVPEDKLLQGAVVPNVNDLDTSSTNEEYPF